MKDGLCSTNLAHCIGEILSPYGFVRRGKTFFRVWGDGILQAVKFLYLIHGTYHELYVGLFSLYSELHQNCFSSTRCPVRYPLVRLDGKESSHWAKLHGKNRLYFDDTSVEEQLTTLKQKGVSFLNSMTTQQHLADAIYRLETAARVEHFTWCDPDKIAPYLKCGNYQSAAKVLRAVLNQRLWGIFRDWNYSFSDAEYFECGELLDDYGRQILEIYKMVISCDSAGLETWMQSNYEVNINRVKFCRSIK